MYVRHAQKIAKIFFSVRSTQFPFQLNILFIKNISTFWALKHSVIVVSVSIEVVNSLICILLSECPNRKRSYESPNVCGPQNYVVEGISCLIYSPKITFAATNGSNSFSWYSLVSTGADFINKEKTLRVQLQRKSTVFCP
jgi:hypothetical protein